MHLEIEHIIAYIVPLIMWALTLAITLRLIIKNQPVSATLSWLMVIYLVPFIGILSYLIFGEINLGKRRARTFKEQSHKYLHWFNQLTENPFAQLNNSLDYKSTFKLAQKRLGIPCISGNELHILDTPSAIMHSIIQDIQQAKSHINMVFYIWQDGGLVNDVVQALFDAQKRGVKISILLDSVGSKHFFKTENYQKMKSAGISIAEALHVNVLQMFLRRIDLRQHRKIIVIDNQIAYTGSMNMVDPAYFKQNADVGKWVDIMVRINGPVSAILNGLHAWDWEIETNQELPITLPTYQLLPIESDNAHSVQIIATGPGFPDDLIAQSLATAIFAARKSIAITSPYFVPSQNIAEALRIAAWRGVEVSIILPKKNDSLMVNWASRAFFDDLLAAGVKIYQFEKGLLHTKSVLIDNRLALVGTVNMDVRSFMLNFEITMMVEDLAFANEVSILHENYLQTSTQLDYSQWKTRSTFSRIIEKLFFLFSPLL